ncbi:AP-4 complex subunit beta-1-like [Eriocheir sinensis]|uniref:AP-4 complex subunit beta-1-like n=1 Tax=Eriocheir sinensis TaxID=95602 RepID=UPI0021C977A2|nr:AP-4 complex subunit beta-1-like [Eriocheir sinensis]XP_050727578.1 AP-4 complex subunit beta-1-like [Eriocheir sinensis]XP_050727579.1 AP-4 complex subunit beta-1-like [Eriocheir sinensis]XP_050727580.1 AP-4 complex subunit beta-1-like [Eriocheir sinensis]XP_050727581.1 AP-4 complex subunit beta-1-like [Eriocheir sinensis]XP_050727582.1 AP-4 complex subunit beta-1-like [Eriocheir sinensis]
MVPMSPEKKQLLSKMIGGADLPTSDVVELLASHDTLCKKLTCFHIADKCSSNNDLALLTANLLLRDASDANPIIRSASISALAALPGVEESAVRALTSALSDQAAMVRRCGALGCVRLFDHAPEAVLECGLTDALYDGLRDSDSIAITNCILALDHILEAEGGIVVNKNIAHYLLGRIMQFSECNAVYVLTILGRYPPKSEEELILLLNTLDELLLSRAPAVLVGTVKLFLHWTQDHPHLKKDMLEVIQPSVCKILSRNISETSYLLLEFLHTLGDIRKVFGPHYKYFLVRAKDPGFLKTQKLKVLPLISTEDNVCCLIEEVKPFCSDYQSFRSAVSCMGLLARVNAAANSMCLSMLVTLLDAPAERVVIAALECLMNIVLSPPAAENDVSENRTEPVPSQPSSEGNVGSQNQTLLEGLFSQLSVPSEEPRMDPKTISTSQSQPELPHDLIEAITRALSLETVQEAAPSLVLFVLGTLAPHLDASPDILQRMSSLSFSPSVHADLVTAAAQIFISRPAQTQLLLAGILARAFKSSDEAASRAALVYATLQEHPSDAAFLLGAAVRHLAPSNKEECKEEHSEGSE